jgi:hypothetical protein
LELAHRRSARRSGACLPSAAEGAAAGAAGRPVAVLVSRIGKGGFEATGDIPVRVSESQMSPTLFYVLCFMYLRIFLPVFARLCLSGISPGSFLTSFLFALLYHCFCIFHL